MHNVLVPEPVIKQVRCRNFQTAIDLLNELVPNGNCSEEYINNIVTSIVSIKYSTTYNKWYWVIE